MKTLLVLFSFCFVCCCSCVSQTSVGNRVKIARYDTERNLCYLEIVGYTWQEFLAFAEKESGFSIKISSPPSGVIHLRLDDPGSWQNALSKIAHSGRFRVVEVSPQQLRFVPIDQGR
jgi:hypothetical protein